MQDESGEATPQTVGQYFRSLRLSHGEDLAVVARTLRIRSDQVAAIEESRLDDLPGRTYAVGFVRSYAQYLGLAPAEYVERFKAEIGNRGEQAPLRGLPEDTGEGRLPYGWLLVGLLVLCVVGYAGYYLVRSANVASTQPIAPVPAVMTPDFGKHASDSKRLAHAQRQGSTKAPANSTGKVAPSPAPASTTTGAPVSPSTSLPQSAALAALPQGQMYGAQNRNARVVLHARTITHVLVEGPGGRVYINRVLHPGDAYRVPDLVGLSLTTPDGGAVLLELDGQVAGAAGRAGQITEALSLDPQAIVDRTHGGTPH